MTIEIVDFPIKHGDFPVRYVKLLEGILYKHIACQMHIDIETAIPLTHRHSWYAEVSPLDGMTFCVAHPLCYRSKSSIPKKLLQITINIHQHTLW